MYYILLECHSNLQIKHMHTLFSFMVFVMKIPRLQHKNMNKDFQTEVFLITKCFLLSFIILCQRFLMVAYSVEPIAEQKNIIHIIDCSLQLNTRKILNYSHLGHWGNQTVWWMLNKKKFYLSICKSYNTFNQEIFRWYCIFVIGSKKVKILYIQIYLQTDLFLLAIKLIEPMVSKLWPASWIWPS